MRFSDQLRSDADPLFTSLLTHPFVLGISAETLQPSQLIHYVRQDFQYLNTYIQLYGLGLAKCENREDMRKFHERIGFVLNDEIHPHLNFCRVAKVEYRDLQRQSMLAPTAHHYATHMLSVAQTGTLGDILAALLPCHWTYVEIAENITTRISPTRDHLFYDWITFYNSDAMKASLNELRDWLDSYALDEGHRSRDRMRQAFLISCRMESRFFDMAYTVENWGDSHAPTC